MDEELIFQYPIQDENGEGNKAELERLVALKAKILFRTRIIFAAILFLIAVFFVLSSFSNVFSVLTIIMFAVLFLFGKTLSGGNNRMDYYTEISAYESFVEIKQTNLTTGKIEQAVIAYDDIKWAMMSKSLERIQICFEQENSEMFEYSMTDNVAGQLESLTCLIDIPLNPYTYQQYYFLYVADDYFKIRIPKVLKTDKYIMKKYGNSDDFAEKIQ